MTLIDAVKSGKPFRRPHWADNYYTHNRDEYHVTVTPKDILADDWEIDEPKVTVTRRELEEAWNKCAQHNLTMAFNLFCQELGLEEK